jgi:hypothetical protein
MASALTGKDLTTWAAEEDIVLIRGNFERAKGYVGKFLAGCLSQKGWTTRRSKIRVPCWISPASWEAMCTRASRDRLPRNHLIFPNFLIERLVELRRLRWRIRYPRIGSNSHVDSRRRFR